MWTLPVFDGWKPVFQRRNNHISAVQAIFTRIDQHAPLG